MNIQTLLGSVAFGGFAIMLAVTVALTPGIADVVVAPVAGPLILCAVALFVGYELSARAGKASGLHPYVWALVFGFALHVPFSALLSDFSTVTLVAELFTALLLFSSGLSVPLRTLGKYLAPIATLSVLGAVLGAGFFAYITSGLAFLMGVPVPFTALFLLGLVLAPSDPLSLRSASRELAGLRPKLKAFIETEGVANDVVGVIAVRLVLVALLTIAGTGYLNGDGFLSTLVTPEALLLFAFEMGWGVLVALVGAWILRMWGATPVRAHALVDRVPFFVVPLFCFALGQVAGAGFLAAFLAGLFYEEQVGHGVSRVHFDRFSFNFLAPTVFVVLGALTPLNILVATASLGIAAAVLFMFLARPLAVTLSLAPWAGSSHPLLSWNESVFLSFLREAGPVSAALLMLVYASGIAGAETILALGVWAMLSLLILEPIVVSAVVRKLGITND